MGRHPHDPQQQGVAPGQMELSVGEVELGLGAHGGGANHVGQGCQGPAALSNYQSQEEDRDASNEPDRYCVQVTVEAPLFVDQGVPQRVTEVSGLVLAPPVLLSLVEAVQRSVLKCIPELDCEDADVAGEHVEVAGGVVVEVQEGGGEDDVDPEAGEPGC